MTATPDERAPSVYGAGFYDEISPASRAAARSVVPYLVELVAPSSVVDVGCGIGAWLAAFVDAGVSDVLGIDGSPIDEARLAIEATRFRRADLEQPPAIGRSFDLAMSLEVAEHLDPSAAGRFVAYLTSLAPTIVFSAAVPGQGGVGHRNEQWPAYWAARFHEHGFHPVDCLRPRVWDDPDVAFYYAQNLLLFAAHERFDAEPGVPVPLVDGVPAPLPLLHPDFVDALVALRAAPEPPPSLRSLVRQLPAATARAITRRARGSRGTRDTSDRARGREGDRDPDRVGRSGGDRIGDREHEGGGGER